MKKLIIIIVIVLLTSIIAFAELSEETLQIVEDLRMKHYGIGRLICIDDQYVITWEPPPPIELIDIEIKGMKFKGWEIWINNKCYYVLLLEKED